MSRRTRLVMLVAAVSVASVGATLWWSSIEPERPTYNQVRKKIIDHARREPMPRPETPPARPADLDTRLPASGLDDLRRLYPVTETNALEFYTLFGQIVLSVYTELRAIDKTDDWYELLSPSRRAVLLTEAVERDLVDGSFEIYYRGQSGDGAMLAPAALRRMGQERLAILVERGNEVFRYGVPTDRPQRLQEMARLGDSALRTWKELDTQVRALPKPPGGITVAGGPPLMLRDPQEFFKIH